MSSPKASIHFNVHPSVIYQLGESLITDTTQALIELVKNSYDACASYAKITIDTSGELKVPGTTSPSKGGVIVIEDDGDGMNRDDISNGWLTLSNRTKKNIKENNIITSCGRTPLGDKGLGRLGVQRLGNYVDILTQHKNDTPYHFAFNWKVFETASSFEDVLIPLNSTSYAPTKGTKIVISELQDIDSWRGANSIKKLEQTLSSMISPYKEAREFDVWIEIDGKTLELVEISHKLLNLSQVRYSYSFTEDSLSVAGKVKLDFFKSGTDKGLQTKFKKIIEEGSVEPFWEYITKQKSAKELGVKRSNSGNWFVEFSYSKPFLDIDDLEKISSQTKKIANPGPFYGSIDSFDLGTEAYNKQTLYSKLQDYRGSIKSLSGILVFRDGFRIRLDHDWLRLGSHSTSAQSYYSLKPSNTLGYIAISAKDNMVLEETTDREGFKDTPYFRNFHAVLSDFIAFTDRAHNFFGRAFPDYLKTLDEREADISPNDTIVDISKTISKGLEAAKTHKTNLEKLKTDLGRSVKEANEIVKTLSNATNFGREQRNQVEKAASSLKGLITEAKSKLETTSEFLSNVEDLHKVSKVLHNRSEAIKTQLEHMYEAVALGLTAEALSHEVFNIADQLAGRSKAVQAKLQKYNLQDVYVLAFVEHVNSVVSSLRKQISFLSPSLRYVREKRDNLSIYKHLGELCLFYEERLKKNKIRIALTLHEDFELKINKGKLSQILDNMVLNSEHWLRDCIDKEIITQGKINFEISYPFLYVWDNGKGIDPSVEQSIFEPFISTKKQGQGRGLGLFINRQLLNSEDCDISILSDRNSYSRLYKFKIDFRGALNG
ncbi:ATP-binding protein [Pseudodesulfovibrio indicus]|uniref:histidine kinase n=1 Tax=Pseudodesulfovibrio indicus TaxID=1716143 RepID=A0AA94PVH6_9BACT|nr:ATP-binding protein [Pseudodesulfovibrio indicus]TDT91014.1 signal transduction histidine kinase [Pseudodesulfovibrio indicus]